MLQCKGSSPTRSPSALPDPSEAPRSLRSTARCAQERKPSRGAVRESAKSSRLVATVRPGLSATSPCSSCDGGALSAGPRHLHQLGEELQDASLAHSGTRKEAARASKQGWAVESSCSSGTGLKASAAST